MKNVSPWCQREKINLAHGLNLKIDLNLVSPKSQLSLILVSSWSQRGSQLGLQPGLNVVSTWSQPGLNVVSTWSLNSVSQLGLRMTNKPNIAQIHFSLNLSVAGEETAAMPHTTVHNLHITWATRSQQNSEEMHELSTTWMAEKWRETNAKIQLDDHLFGPSRTQALTLAKIVDEDKDVGQNCEQTHLRELAENTNWSRAKMEAPSVQPKK